MYLGRRRMWEPTAASILDPLIGVKDVKEGDNDEAVDVAGGVEKKG